MPAGHVAAMANPVSDVFEREDDSSAPAPAPDPEPEPEHGPGPLHPAHPPHPAHPAQRLAASSPAEELEPGGEVEESPIPVESMSSRYLRVHRGNEVARDRMFPRALEESPQGKSRSHLLSSGSNAVTSEIFWELNIIGRMLNTPAGLPSTTYKVMQGMIVLAATIWVVIVPFEGARLLALPRGAAFMHAAADVFFALGMLSLLLPLTDVKGVLLHDDKDSLASLGVGTTAISAEANRSLILYRYGLWLLTAGFVIIFILMVFGGILFPNLFPEGYTALWIAASFAGATIALVGPVSLCAWRLTMRMATTIGTDDVIEVIIACQQVSPTVAGAWREQVTIPAQDLAASMEQISFGWSTGIEGVTATCWCWAMFCFLNAVNSPALRGLAPMFHLSADSFRFGLLVVSGFFFAFPMLLAGDIALISTK